MPARIEGAVLALAVRVVLGLADDLRAGRGCSCVMGLCVVDADEERRARGVPLDRDHRAALVHELRPVVADLEALLEPECARQPLDGLAHVGVGKLGNDSRLGHGSVCLHDGPFVITPV